MQSHKIKQLARFVFYGGLLVLTAGLFFPVFARTANHIPTKIIQSHQIPTARHYFMAQGKSREELAVPLIRVSWFYQQNPRYGRSQILFRDGTTRSYRYGWPGVRGGGSTQPDKNLLQKVRAVPPLTNGWSDYHRISTKRLLIVSQSRNGEWITNYYDRDQLPPSVQDIARLFNID